MIPVTLDSAERACLASIADLLIPRGSKMPSASEADVPGAGIDKVFSVRPDLINRVRAALIELGTDIPGTFYELDDKRTAHFGALAEAVTAAYYLNPTVQERVGYSTRSEIPIEFDDDLAELTSAVLSRGPIYRPTPVALAPGESPAASPQPTTKAAS
ncbi:hypothetical protein [Arthrobacter ramosus]|uniref:Uncharacterized protein n=1 Tax=Arthrobacter ramosus TaxID=1672 RepID=A0ABV5XWR0_ARTRM|nr:hypothetical protein [Arthrobacter ramosus]